MKNFHYEPLDIPVLKREMTPSGRVYLTPTGERYPSVTTVLSADEKKKKSLAEWRKRVGEEEANRKTNVAARRGTAIHTLMEDYVLGKPVTPSMPDLTILYNQLKKAVDVNVTRIYGVESTLYSHRLKIGGSCDLIADWNGHPSIIDYKTSDREKRDSMIRDYYHQATLYSLMLEEITGIKAKQIVVLIASLDTIDCMTFTKTRNQYIIDSVRRVKDYHACN